MSKAYIILTTQGTPSNHTHPDNQSWSHGGQWSWLSMQSKVHQMVGVGKLLVGLNQTALSCKLQTIHTPKTAAKASCYEVGILYALLVVLAWFCILSTCIGIWNLESIHVSGLLTWQFWQILRWEPYWLTLMAQMSWYLDITYSHWQGCNFEAPHSNL